MKKFTFFTFLMLFAASIFAQTWEAAPINDEAGSGLKSTNATGWTLQFSPMISSTTWGPGTAGIESDGTNIYVAKWASNKFYKMTTAGAVLDSFAVTGSPAFPASNGVRDLAYDGQYFYGCCNNNIIYKMDFTAKTIVGSITLPTGIAGRHISYDPTADGGLGGFWVGGWSDNIVLYSRTGTTLNTIPSTGVGTTYSAYGSAFDTVSPGGPYLWLYSQTGTNGNQLLQIKISTKAFTGLTHDVCGDIPGSAVGSGAGGCFLTKNLITGTTTLGGLIQGTAFWGYNLASTIPPTFGLSVKSLNMADYILANNAQPITGTLNNFGATTITTFALNYSINGGAAVTQNVTGASIASYANYTYTHATPWTTPATLGTFTVKVWATNVNGNSAWNSDTITKVVTTVSSVPTKRVYCEEATGTWCGWCIRGIVNMDAMAVAHPTDWVGIAVHNGDKMVVTAWDAGVGSFPGFSGYPSIVVDRTLLVDPSAASTAYTTQKAVVSPVDVAITNLTYTAGVASFNVKATPVITGTVDWRLNAAVYEMDVTWQQDPSPVADSSGYRQSNYYAGGANGAMGGYENLASTVPANYMHYNFVGRAILDGYAGVAGSIPSAITSGTAYTKNYSYTVPAYSRAWNMYVVGFVIDNASGKVLNAIQVPLSSVGINETNNELGLAIYPNPAKENVQISYNLTKKVNVSINIYNSIGGLVFTQNQGELQTGSHTANVKINSLSSGIYFINVKAGDNIITKKLIVE
ncbi:MAG: Omp28-related outer membrane protein [Bacteroidetes bacterium]|nr:Omp28-related outer membrane protein [Bacteroidota bacterium]